MLVPERAPNLIYNTPKILYYYFLTILDTKKNTNKSKGYPLPATLVHFQLTTPPRFSATRSGKNEPSPLPGMTEDVTPCVNIIIGDFGQTSTLPGFTMAP